MSWTILAISLLVALSLPKLIEPRIDNPEIARRIRIACLCIGMGIFIAGTIHGLR